MDAVEIPDDDDLTGGNFEEPKGLGFGLSLNFDAGGFCETFGKTEGINFEWLAVFVGESDLCLSLGLTGEIDFIELG